MVYMNNKALTLLEILVAVVILALVVTGLVNVFVAGKRYIKHSRLRMAGGELGKKFLDPLQSYVRQDTWSTNLLGTDSAGRTGATQDGYTPTYDTGALTNNPNIRKVKVTINWPEAE